MKNLTVAQDVACNFLVRDGQYNQRTFFAIGYICLDLDFDFDSCFIVYLLRISQCELQGMERHVRVVRALKHADEAAG